MALSVREVTAGYTREVPILKGVSLEARTGLVTVIIGPNGAGKSTLLRAIYGYLRPSSGTVEHDGTTLVGLPPARMLAHGIAYLLQGRSTFPSMTIEENLELGAWTIRRDKARVAQAFERIYGRYPQLKERRRRPAGGRSGGGAPAGGCALGRRAAAARGGAAHHDRSQDPAARRALGRPDAEAGRRGLRGDRPPQGGPLHHPGRRPERQAGDRHRGLGVCA